MTAATRTFTVADDELSRLVRIFKLGSAFDGSIQPHRKPIEEVLEGLLTWFCDQLTGMGWPDPTACLVFRDGEWTGEAIDPSKLHLREQEAGVKYVPSATAIRHDLESRGFAFEDAWYCAAMVDNLLSALAGTDNQRPYAMIAVGWWFRDWEWRRNHRKNAILGRNQRDANRRRGERSKRRAWADALAEFFVAIGVRDQRRAQSMIPNADDGNTALLEINDDAGFYLSGKKLVCVDPVTNFDHGKMTWNNFERRYLRLALQRRGQ